MSPTLYSQVASAAHRYFYSGWAFFIPYLAAYLLYYVTGWPVNPAEPAPADAPHALFLDFPTSYRITPSLLYVYWTLHALHFILAAITLRSSWREGSENRKKFTSRNDSLNPNWCTHPLMRKVPWALLALVFYIPGVYLEWPSDPWEHLRRINEWQILDKVKGHSSWAKSSYFLPYSLTGRTTGLWQLAWLNVYYTVICLLLAWQNYRLARAIGLGERTSFVFVLLNALTFGNNIFSFHRYYGLSSSIIAQLGSLALTRIAITILVGSRATAQTARQRTSTARILVPPRQALSETQSRPQLKALGAIFPLLFLVAFNHIQGIGIAGIEILAILVWRLINWKRAMIAWLALLIALLSIISIIWFPRQPELDQIFVPQGWLTSWYSFAILTPHLPASERAIQILGILGIANLVLAICLLHRNHVVSWLCLMPIVCLSLPFTVIPYANAVVYFTSWDNIVTYNRMLLGIPAMLAIVTALSKIGNTGIFRRKYGELVAYALPTTLVILMVTSEASPQYNRVWHSLAIPASDLVLKDFVTQYADARSSVQNINSRNYVIAPPAGSALVATTPLLEVSGGFRSLNDEPVNVIARNIDFLKSAIPGSLSQTPIPPRELAPQLMNSSTWIVHRGSPVEFHRMPSDPSINLIQNIAGESSEVFSGTLIPISPEKTYHLRMNVRQATKSAGVVMLAVAWYDRQGNLLESNVKFPNGAGSPHGWTNGTYSYFGPGLVRLPTAWTTYSVNFGRHEKATIPQPANFIRIGALLNSRSTPAMVTQLSAVSLTEIPSPEVIAVLPSAMSVTTTGSQTATLSMHWRRWQAVYDRAGTNELQSAIETRISKITPSSHK